MPPALSDQGSVSEEDVPEPRITELPDDEDEDMSDGLDQIPAKPTTNGKGNDKDEDAEDDDDEEDEDSYVVEKIVEHSWSKKEEKWGLLYRVKWLGYDATDDMTWEPQENLETAAEAVAAYHKSVGGTPEPPGSKASGRSSTGRAKAKPAPASTGRGKRKRAVSPEEADDDVQVTESKTTKKKSRTSSATNGQPDHSRTFLDPSFNWEKEVNEVTSVEQAKGKTKAEKDWLRVYVSFTNGGRLTCNMPLVRQRCPQRLIDYYESHLTWKSTQEMADMPGQKAKAAAAAEQDDDDDDEDEEEEEEEKEKEADANVQVVDAD